MPRRAAGRVGRAAIFAGAIALAPIGCGPKGPTYEPLTHSTAGETTTGAVRGVIRRHDGAPAVHLGVRLYGDALRSHPASQGADALFAQADANGAFVLADIPPGDYRMEVDGGDHYAVSVRAGQATVFDIELPEPPEVDPRHMAKPYGAPPARRRVV